MLGCIFGKFLAAIRVVNIKKKRGGLGAALREAVANLNDRAADNWRPLLAIADLVGGTWPEEACWAACLVSGEEQDGAIGVELLRDMVHLWQRRCDPLFRPRGQAHR